MSKHRFVVPCVIFFSFLLCLVSGLPAYGQWGDGQIDSEFDAIVMWSAPQSATCVTNSNCNDGVECNGQESCVGGSCVAGTPTCEDGAYCDEDRDTCIECLVDAECDDGVVCNGAESCAGGSCYAGTSTCEDGEYCDEKTDTCEEKGPWSFEQVDPDCGVVAMWASSETDMYVGGTGSTPGSPFPTACLYHNDGTGWEPISLPGFLGVIDIWGSSGDDVYVVGAFGGYHYDGTNWTSFGSGRFTASVWGFSEDDVFMGSSAVIQRYQGAAWDAMLLPEFCDLAEIRGIWGQSSSDLYAIGVKEGGSASVVLHYDGNQDDQWEWHTAGFVEGSYLLDVWASSPDDVFATGIGVIMHYDGNQWTEQDIPSSFSYSQIFNISGTASDDVYAVVYPGGILHYDGSAWSIIKSAADVVSHLAASDVGLSMPLADLPDSVGLKAMHVVSASSIYFAGDNGIVIHYTPDVAAECENDGDCDDGLFCTGAETCDSGSCVATGDPCEQADLMCDEGSDTCEECIGDDNCTEEEVCSDKTCMLPCYLSVEYKQIVSEKLNKPRKRMLKIFGIDGFDPEDEFDFGPFEVLKIKPKLKKGMLKVKVRVPAGLEPQTVTIRVGDCLGEVEIL